jgi:hypothetical protein
MNYTFSRLKEYRYLHTNGKFWMSDCSSLLQNSRLALEISVLLQSPKSIRRIILVLLRNDNHRIARATVDVKLGGFSEKVTFLSSSKHFSLPFLSIREASAVSNQWNRKWIQ